MRDVASLVDFQAGLGFGVESASRQVLLNNAVALARTAGAFGVPVVVSTSASRVYSGQLLPALQDALPAVKAIERRFMNVWEDDTVKNSIVATGRQLLGVHSSCSPECAVNVACGCQWSAPCLGPPGESPS
jgi:hypothetical protein